MLRVNIADNNICYLGYNAKLTKVFLQAVLVISEESCRRGMCRYRGKIPRLNVAIGKLFADKRSGEIDAQGTHSRRHIPDRRISWSP